MLDDHLLHPFMDDPATVLVQPTLGIERAEKLVCSLHVLQASAGPQLWYLKSPLLWLFNIKLMQHNHTALLYKQEENYQAQDCPTLTEAQVTACSYLNSCKRSIQGLPNMPTSIV